MLPILIDRSDAGRSRRVLFLGLRQLLICRSTRLLAKLAESKDVYAAKIEQLKRLLADTKKLKADDLETVFSAPAGGDVK
jgi:predicted transcriptional regulator